MRILPLLTSLISAPLLTARMTVDDYIHQNSLPLGTRFGTEELKDLLEEFLLNAEGQRHFTKQQFLESYQQYYPEGDGKVYCNFLFKAFDYDQSGSLEFPEFANVLGIIHRGKFNDRATLGFHVYDVNRDGYITEKEMLKVTEAYHKYILGAPITPQVIKEVYDKTENTFTHMDEDLDGILVEKEFIKGCRDDSTIIDGLSLFDGFKINSKKKKGQGLVPEDPVKTKVGR